MNQPVKILGKCPACGAPNQKGTRFCEYCGSWIGAEESFEVPNASSAVQEQKEASVFEPLPGWEDGTSFSSNAPVSSVYPQNAGSDFPTQTGTGTAAARNLPEQKQPKGLFRTWKSFLPVWTVFCALFSFLPFLNVKSGDETFVFIFSWLPGIILFALSKHRGFCPPSWILLFFEVIIVCFLILLLTIGRWAASPSPILSDVLPCCSLLFCIFIVIRAVIWKRNYRG